MIVHAITISLIITAIYRLFQEGMLLGWLRIYVANALDNGLFTGGKVSKYIQKPLWDCLTCMASVWTIILTFDFDLKLILIVCGINAIIDKFLEE